MVFWCAKREGVVGGGSLGGVGAVGWESADLYVGNPCLFSALD